ncbi:hypothetical protein [Spirulina sp. 06S082]|uniref:hypothetical protein n=1 Tax=Spirulina sp. 06S082 TaxID=3110248 RepID=UPI002B1F1D7A|nr:hypothetical protein [Spirulina sp. 06S082]MEA5471422.1 hypothetical protein [Spirulina sp. 06S082]
MENLILRGLEISLSTLAKNEPEQFREFIKEIKNSQFETIQFLLIRAYSANGKEFADDAINYLCENPMRFQIGYGGNSGNIHAAPYWTARELVQATTPYCSSDRLLKLTHLLFDYYPEKEYVTQNNLTLRGYAQFILLDAIAVERRTVEVEGRLEEWKRKFISIEFLDRSGKIEPPKPMKADIVGSPITEEADKKMTNEQWLKAIVKYNQEGAGLWFERDGQLVGNARELAIHIQYKAKQEPMRFAKLLHQFSSNTNTVYFNNILWGIAETNLDLDLDIVVDTLKYCHELTNKPCGSSISWLLTKKSNLPWPSEIFDIIIWYALNDPNPERESWRTEASSGQVYYGGDPFTAGINSVRGSAFGAIGNLIASDPDRTEYFIPTLQNAVSDRSIAVRTCVAQPLVALLNFDRDLAVKLLQELCKTEDILLGTRWIERFLKYATYTHFKTLQPILERMILSDVKPAREVGSRQICLAALHEEAARNLANECLHHTSIHRKAVAKISVANLRSPDYCQSCEDFLVQLVNDPDEEVCIEVARCFHLFEGKELENYTNLIETFVRSKAFEIDSKSLFRALQKTTAELPDITYEVCAHYVQNILKSTEKNLGISGDNVSQLLIRTYSQKKALQSQCLDLIDSLAEISAYGLEKNLASYER